MVARFLLLLLLASCRSAPDPGPARMVQAQEFDLHGPPAGGASVRGVIYTRTGSAVRDPNLWLRMPGEMVSDRRAEVEWLEVGGELVGQFEIRGLPESQFEVSLSPNEFFSWSRSHDLVTPPAFIELFCEDTRDVVDYDFRVFDAESGSELKTFHWMLTWSHGEGSDPRGRGGVGRPGCEVRQVPRDLGWNWSIAAPGYAERQGTSSGLEYEDVQGARVVQIFLDALDGH